MWIGHRKEIRKLTFRALFLRRSEEKNLIASYSYSSANSSSIPVVHALLDFFTKKPGYQAPWLCQFNTSDIFYITTSKRFFKHPSTIILAKELTN